MEEKSARTGKKREQRQKTAGLRQTGVSQSQKGADRKQADQKQGNRKQVNQKQADWRQSEGCPVAKKCGGCDYQGLLYEEQLKKKEKMVRILLDSFGKVHPIIGMENPYHYRNKVHAVFDRDRKGNAISGVYQKGTHKVVPLDTCLIEDEKADEIIVSIRGLLKSFKIRIYDEDSQYGLLRHVLVKRGFSTGEIMVVLVTASPVFPSKNNFVKALRKLHPEITTIVQNINDRGTSMVLGKRDIVLFGKGYIEDELCGKIFRISPKSFYQVNPVQTEKLYGKAMEYAGLTGSEVVVDAYCGTGTIGMIAAERAGKVIGVELNPDAVRDAKSNAKRNGVNNIEFYQNDAGKFLVEMAQQKAKVDVVLMDPPRSGSSEEFLNSVAQLAPKRVVYISCNPETLVRDIKYLTKRGYTVQKGVAVDMFPFTDSCEAVVWMKRTER